MDWLMMVLVTVMVPVWYIWPSREISMTFKTNGRSILIKNDRLAELLIAEKNSWGIATDLRKRNRMSLWGVVSHMLLLPQIAFMPYNWWVFFTTGSGKWVEAEQAYLFAATCYYIIGLSVKLREAKQFRDGEIW